MKRAALVLTLALALPAAAHAKGGIQFDSDTQMLRFGEVVTMHVFVAGNHASSDYFGQVVARRPLITFRSASGRVVRLRASRTDDRGIAVAVGAFPDAGPWKAGITVCHWRIEDMDWFSFHVGAGPWPEEATAHPPISAGPAPLILMEALAVRLGHIGR